MLIVIAYPIYYTVDLSFFMTPPGLQLRGQDLRRNRQLHGHPHQRRVLEGHLNTLIWTLASTLIAFVLGFATALALNRYFIGRGVMRAILIIPWVISVVAASYIWKWIYHSDFGVIGAILVALASPTGRRTLSTASARSAVADRGQHLARVPLRHDHDDGRPADRSRPVAARRHGRWGQRLAALLARHVSASERRFDRDDPAARGGELQLPSSSHGS